MRPAVTKIFLLLFTVLTAVSCHYPASGDHWTANSANEIDSVEFRTAHHYWRGYNFVATDSFRIFSRPPFTPEPVYASDSSVVVCEDDVLVVEDVAADSLDDARIWVKVAAVGGFETYGPDGAYAAAERIRSGWVPESELLSASVPDEPVSKFIRGFSDGRLKLALSCVGLAVLLYLVQAVRRRRVRLVHFNDVDSFYPTLLCLVVSGMAVLYQTLQVYVPETWVEFYFHPTLNPFHPGLPPVMSLLVAAVWAFVLSGVAVLDDLRRRPDLPDGFSYVAGLGAACMLLYLFFTVAVPPKLGYALLALYWWFAIRRYRRGRPRYLCGRCGRTLAALGTCPHCGALNER